MSFVDGQGKRHQPTAYFDTKKKALYWLHEQHDKHNKGQLADSGKRTVGQWLDEWLTIKKPQVEPNTRLLRAERADSSHANAGANPARQTPAHPRRDAVHRARREGCFTSPTKARRHYPIGSSE